MVIEFSVWVDDENIIRRNSNILIAHCISVTIAKATVKWFLIFGEQFEDILQAGDFEDLRSLEDDFSFE